MERVVPEAGGEGGERCAPSWKTDVRSTRTTPASSSSFLLKLMLGEIRGSYDSGIERQASNGRRASPPWTPALAALRSEDTFHGPPIPTVLARDRRPTETRRTRGLGRYCSIICVPRTEGISCV